MLHTRGSPLPKTSVNDCFGVYIHIHTLVYPFTPLYTLYASVYIPLYTVVYPFITNIERILAINVANRILYLYFTCEESETSNQRRVQLSSHVKNIATITSLNLTAIKVILIFEFAVFLYFVQFVPSTNYGLSE